MLTVQYVKSYNMSLEVMVVNAFLRSVPSFVVQKENQTKLYYYIKKLSLCNFYTVIPHKKAFNI